MLSRNIKRLFVVMLTFLMASITALCQFTDNTVRWKVEQKLIEDNLYELVFTGQFAMGWHTYSINDPTTPTILEFEEITGAVLEGEATDVLSSTSIKISQKIRLEAEQASVKGLINWRSCKGNDCRSPEDWFFEESIGGSATVTISEAPSSSAPKKAMDWTLIIEAILWGFAMLLTPCVFPMVPMTISFFIKGQSNPVVGRFKALMYGLFIVLLYTIPISLIIIITRIVGGDAVTADIFNWLSTHWLPNIIFFIIFMIFAVSFFGAFEITLPSSIVNKSDSNSDKKGLAGIFFMALTLVLVSFSCTGPIVGTVLIKSTQGEFWTPMVTMLAFSLAFALPFTILALFPSLLKNLPKSGGWLNSVKVVLGFVEVALGLKFLSVADQTYHWGLLNREIYLAIWIVCFTLMGFYLLGKLRFKHDSPLEYISVGRLMLAIGVFSFVVYLIPGMWGAPLKALSGYLPPMSTQEFVISYNNTPTSSAPSADEYELGDLLELPYGLQAYPTIEEGIAAAKAQGKRIFVDITGHGCVNCREMESRVWSDPEVLKSLKEDFVMVALYTDDKTKLPEDKWIETESGRQLKDVGRVNSHIALKRFGVNAQPNYIILSADGEQLSPARGYDLSIEGFLEFLSIGKQ